MIGDNLVVTGISNREENMVILVTCKGPVELTPQAVYIANGTWTATFDTSTAEWDVYIIKADDGDVAVTARVNIVPLASTVSTNEIGNETGIVDLNNTIGTTVSLLFGEKVMFTNNSTNHLIIGKAPDAIAGIVFGAPSSVQSRM